MKHEPSLRIIGPFNSTEGSILVTTLLTILVLSMMTVAIISRISSRHAATYQSVVWNEAMTSAEAGSDFAVRAMNNSVANPGTAWIGWKRLDGTANEDNTTFPKYYNFNPPAHVGESNTKVFAKLYVDNSITDSNGTKWMRIRSTGVAECPHGTQEGTEASVRDINGVKNHRSALRKPRSYTDITGGVLHLPQVARTVEIMAAPPGTSLYIRALTVRNGIAMSGGAFTDGFDSGDPAHSDNGQYPSAYPARILNKGDVATNANGTLSDLKSAVVNGDASSNGGAISNTGGVTGTVYNNFQTTISKVNDPYLNTIEPNPTSINNPGAPVTLVGGSSTSPKNYELSVLTISNSAKPLILAPSAPGVESYINILVTGKTTVSGSGYIQQQPNVHVNFYCDDDVTISGSGYLNQTNIASNLVMYGVSPSSGTNKMTISGSATFIGILNAPDFDITISGGGKLVGAAIGNSVDLSGSGGFHYDVALSRLGGTGTSTYAVASWVEDIR